MRKKRHQKKQTYKVKCLKFKFGTHQRVCVHNFLFKKSNLCTLLSKFNANAGRKTTNTVPSSLSAIQQAASQSPYIIAQLYSTCNKRE
jgi:hypothetical protein